MKPTEHDHRFQRPQVAQDVLKGHGLRFVHLLNAAAIDADASARDLLEAKELHQRIAGRDLAFLNFRSQIVFQGLINLEGLCAESA